MQFSEMSKSKKKKKCRLPESEISKCNLTGRSTFFILPEINIASEICFPNNAQTFKKFPLRYIKGIEFCIPPVNLFNGTAGQDLSTGFLCKAFPKKFYKKYSPFPLTQNPGYPTKYLRQAFLFHSVQRQPSHQRKHSTPFFQKLHPWTFSCTAQT